MGSDNGAAKGGVMAVVWWLKKQPPRVRDMVCLGFTLLSLWMIRAWVSNPDYLFTAAETVHLLGLAVLSQKLTQEKNCAGLSLKTQELTALFLGVRLVCSVSLEQDIHTVLDLLTLVATVWVVFTIRNSLSSTYDSILDDLPSLYVVVPCAVLSVLVHPSTTHSLIHRILWAFCVYLEAVSVLPQLRVMQKAKVVEPSTATYVFALGVARFLTCAFWIIQVIDGKEKLFNTKRFDLWPMMAVLSEGVQTFILADFCYYYIKSVISGQGMVQLPMWVV